MRTAATVIIALILILTAGLVRNYITAAFPAIGVWALSVGLALESLAFYACLWLIDCYQSQSFFTRYDGGHWLGLIGMIAVAVLLGRILTYIHQPDTLMKYLKSLMPQKGADAQVGFNLGELLR